MSARHVAAAATAALLAAASIAHAQDSSAVRGHLLVGAGINLTPGGSPGTAIQVGREWSAPGSRFALRLTGDYTRAQESHRVYPGYVIDGSSGSVSSSTQNLSLGLGTTYTLHRGRIQPYLLSGFLVQFQDLRTRYDASGARLAPGVTEPASFDYRDRGLGLGLQGGIGISATVGAASLFVESRAFMPVAGLRATRSSPLTFGIRF